MPLRATDFESATYANSVTEAYCTYLSIFQGTDMMIILSNRYTGDIREFILLSTVIMRR